MSELSKNIENNWDKIQEKIQKEWNLTKDDLHEIGNSYDNLITKIKKEYGYTEKQIKESLNSFLEEPDVKNVYEEIKNKTHELQSNFSYCIKNHPIKSLGIALVGGLLLARLLK